MVVQHQGEGPVATDPRLAAVHAARADQARRTARGVPAWEEAAPAPGAGPGRLRLPELVLGFCLTLEAFSFTVAGIPLPVNELAMLALLGLALCRRARQDTSDLGVLALAAGAVGVFLAVVSASAGIPDLDWGRRLLRMAALAGLVGCFAGGRVDLRSVIVGMLSAMALNVPLFYAGLVPAPYGKYLTGFLADKNVAGLYYAAIPVLACMYVRSPRRRAWLLAAAFVLVFLTGSRTSLAGLACAAVWMVVTPRMAVGARLALLAGLGWLVSYAEENLAQLAVFGDRTGTDWFRAQIQAATAAKAAQTPWHGMGLTEAHVQLDKGVWLFHNSYAGLFVEGGYVLFLSVVGVYAVFGLRLFTRRLRTPSRVAVEAATAVVFVTAAQLGEVFITIPGMLIVAAGVSLALKEKHAPLEAEVVRRRHEQILQEARARWA